MLQKVGLFIIFMMLFFPNWGALLGFSYFPFFTEEVINSGRPLT